MKKRLSLVLALFLALQVLPFANAASPKAGANCTTLNLKLTVGGKLFTCVKSGKKLIWNKGVSTKTISASSSSTSTSDTKSSETKTDTSASNNSMSASEPDKNAYLEPIMKSLNVNECKIKEVNRQSALAAGFPFVTFSSDYLNKIKIAVIPIDFEDMQGESNIKAKATTQMQLMADWYSSVSQGKFSITWSVQDDWIRLPGKSTDYAVPYSGAYPQTSNFWQKVLPVIESKVDLSGVQTINFILPFNQNVIAESVQSFPFLSEMINYNSTKTKLVSFAAPGVYFNNASRSIWAYWAHEFGHVLGLAHIGTSRGSSQPVNGYNIMGNQDGPYREMGGWQRFLIGWLDDSQVYCQDLKDFQSNTISLVPLSDSNPGIKLVILPTASDSAITIESRRPTRFSCAIPNLPGGVLVNTYDAKMGDQSYFLTAQYPSNRARNILCPGNDRMEPYPDVLLHKGDSITVGNYKISVISSGNYDQVKIEKA